jgi:thermitase
MTRLTSVSLLLFPLSLWTSVAHAAPSIRHHVRLKPSLDRRHYHPEREAPQQQIIEYRPGKFKAVAAAARAQGGRIVERLPQLNALIISDTPEGAKRIVASIASAGSLDPDVNLHAADADCAIVTNCTIPDDPDFNQQWYLENDKATIQPAAGGVLGDDIDAARGWSLDPGSANVKIAIVDTGIDPNQPDLASRIVENWAIPEDNGNTSDVSGHGTAVAGIAAAIPANGQGIAGVAENASILNIKVSTAKHPDTETCSALASGILAAVKGGANVINVSAGSSTPCTLEQEAVSYAWNQGALVVAAAGNYGSSQPFYPAAYENVIAVASTDAYDRPASFADGGHTNRGASWVDLAAPGVDILTTLPTYPNSFGHENYGFVDGTSFSAPMVSGAAALLFAEGLTNREVQTRLLEHANPIAETGSAWRYGLLDVCASIATNQDSCPQSNPPQPLKASEPASPAPIPAAITSAATLPPNTSGSARRPTTTIYRGHTSQHVPITLRMSSDGVLRSVRFSYETHCEQSTGSAPQRLSVHARPHAASLLQGSTRSFAVKLTGAMGEGFYLIGHLTGGTLTGSLTSQRSGGIGWTTCAASTVRWTATH